MEVKAEEKTVSPQSAGQSAPSKKWLIAGAVLVLGVSGFFLKDVFKPAAKSSQVGSQAVLTVDLTSLSHLPLERKLLVNGTVWAWDPVQVGSEINGLKVVSVLVDDGAHVRQGQVLAELNNSVLKAQLAKQQANLGVVRGGVPHCYQNHLRVGMDASPFAHACCYAV